MQNTTRVARGDALHFWTSQAFVSGDTSAFEQAVGSLNFMMLEFYPSGLNEFHLQLNNQTQVDAFCQVAVINGASTASAASGRSRWMAGLLSRIFALGVAFLQFL